MPTDTEAPITFSASATPTDLTIVARARSPFAWVTLKVGPYTRHGLGRARYSRWPPYSRAEEPEPLVVTARVGGATATYTVDDASPVQLSFEAGEARAYAPMEFRFSAEGADPLGAELHASDPWGRTVFDLPAAGTLTVVPYGESFTESWDLVWHGYIVDHEEAAVAVAPPRLDLDGDGVSTIDGDCDDHDADVHPGAPDPSGDRLDQDCDGQASGRSGRPVAPTQSEVQGVPWTAVRLDREGGGATIEVGTRDEGWVALETVGATYIGQLPLTVTASAPVWVEIWDGGPLDADVPFGFLGPEPVHTVRVEPGRAFAPRESDSWSKEPPVPLPPQVRHRGLTGVVVDGVSAGVVGFVTAPFRALEHLLGGPRYPVWYAPLLPPNERVFVRVIPADDLVATRTVKVSLGPPP